MGHNRFANFILYTSCVFGFTLLVSFNTAILQDSLSHKSFKELYQLYRISKNTNPEKAQIYAEKLYQNAIKENNRKHIAKALYCKAYIQKNLGNSKMALTYIDSSLTIARQISNDSLKLKNTNLKGVIYSFKGDYREALTHYLEAQRIAKQLGNLNDILIMSRNVGIIRIKISDYKSAIDVFLDNLKKIKSSKIKNFEREHALNYYNISYTYLKMEALDLAQAYSDSALVFNSMKSLSDLHVPFYSNRAIINFQQQNYKTTIEICNKLISEITDTRHEEELLTAYIYLGKSYFELQSYDLAITFFEKVKTLVNTNNISFPELEETYSLLVKSYISVKKLEEARINSDLLTEFNKKREAANTDVNYKIQQDLGSKIDTLDIENKQQKRRMNLLYTLAVCLIVIFSIIYLQKQALNNKRFKKLLLTIDELEQSQNQPTVEPKTATKDVNPEHVEHILKALDKFENSELFLNTQCNLVYVAKKLKTNTTYLSKVINKYKGKPFKSYLTELRINASLVHLKNNKQLRLYTIKALAEEFGFKRYETFSRAFKTQTGIYPSAYIKNLQKEKL